MNILDQIEKEIKAYYKKNNIAEIQKNYKERVVGICIYCGKPIFELDDYLINDNLEYYHETCREKYLFNKY